VSVTSQLSVSLDGFVAGPDQSADNPIGVGGMKLHAWHLDSTHEVDRRVTERMLEGNGAYIMGRKMFGGGDGPWDESWRGWWGDDPPYHAPVFVLTHHERDRLPMEGGTTFHFVTDGIESALEQAREAAGEKDVAIAGGAQAVRQYLAAGHVEYLHLHIAPVLLGRGERLLEDVGTPGLEQLEVLSSPAATHVKYRVLP
jgi:dihydrofolate reductase